MNSNAFTSFVFLSNYLMLASMYNLGTDNAEYMRYLQTDEVDGEDSTNDSYRCARDCCKHPEPRICYYKFVIEQYTAMGPACKNCANGTESDCYLNQCITADGRERMVYSINRKIPAPTINVCLNDRIIADVNNAMISQSTTIHWHGILQKHYPWMDGVPYVTQCLIPPNSVFRYDFVADTPGSHLYHSHIGSHQKDGLYGGLIVRQCSKAERTQYDHDYLNHTIVISSWQCLPSDTYFPGYYGRLRPLFPMNPDNILINGQGSFKEKGMDTGTPHAKFHVKSGGLKYRFRILSVVTSNCPTLFTIENHALTVIAVDGQPVLPVNVSSVLLGGGMRTDVILTTHQETKCHSSYNIVVKALGTCNAKAPQTAYLIYDDCPTTQPPKPSSKNLTDVFKLPFLDNVKLGCNNNKSICSSQLRSPDPIPNRLTCGKPDKQYFMDLANYRLTHDEVFNNTKNTHLFFYLPMDTGDPEYPNRPGLYVDVINNITMLYPPCPLLTQECPMPKDMVCRGKCDKPPCHCVNIWEVNLGDIVEVVISDSMGNGFNHPMHLHGHTFVVLDQGTAEQRKQDRYWEKNYCKVKNPIRRDVVMTPNRGYAVIRFLADNPGFWVFHCHFQNHAIGGMFGMFKVGKRSEFPAIPKDFPKCGSYLPRSQGLSKYFGGTEGDFVKNKYTEQNTRRH